LSFRLHPENAAPAELSAVLYDATKPLTETWRYLCPISRE
jgi:glucan biosynthesis protein